MRYLTSDEITALAMSVLEEATDAHRLIFKSWIYFAVREIGVIKEDIKVCTLPVKELSFKKPQDLIRVENVVLLDENGGQVSFKYQTGSKRIKEQVEFGGSEGRRAIPHQDSGTRVDLGEDRYFFHLGSNGDKVKKAKIRYYAAPIDENGDPLVPEPASQAVIMYIRYMWAMRKDNNQARIDTAYNMYLRERDRAIGRLNTPSQMQGEQIATEWLSMINAPRKSKF